MNLGLGLGICRGGGASPSVFDPTTLALSGYWRAAIGTFAVPWPATASAGVSGTTGSLVTAGSDPTAGATQNGYTPAAFAAASSQYLTNPTIMSTLFTAAAGTCLALAWFVSEATANAAVYLDAPLLCDDNIGNMGLAINSTGAHVFGLPAGLVAKDSAAVSTGAYHLLMMRWNGTTLGITVDSAAEATVACGNLTGMTGAAWVGRSYVGPTSTFLDGRVLELATATYAFSASDYTNFKGYCNTTYALAL